jgi:hypothetical protein
MLVIDVSVNRVRLVDAICIHRVRGKSPDICRYVIERPKGYESKVFVHRYSDGYLALICKCFNYLKRQGYEPRIVT